MNVSECSLVNWIVVSYIYSWVLMTLFVNFVEHTHSRHEPHYSPQSLVIQCAEEPSYLPHSIAQCIYIKNKIYIGLFSQKSDLMFFVSIWQCYHHTCTSVPHITHEWARLRAGHKDTRAGGDIWCAVSCRPPTRCQRGGIDPTCRASSSASSRATHAKSN